MQQRTPATMTLIACILAGFGFEVVTGAWSHPEILVQKGSIWPYAISVKHEYWRLLTAMFLHGDGTPRGTLIHLLFNVMALYNIGRIYELLFGSKRFTLIYFVTGIAASITSWLHIQGSSVGASGAIFGVLGALVSSIQRSPRFRNDRNARSILRQCVFWIIINVVIGFTIPQIDLAAHLGGLVAGLLLGWMLPYGAVPEPPGAMVIDVNPYEGPAEDPAARRDDRSPRE